MESLHYLLMKAHSMHQRVITAGALSHGLSSGQPKVLDYLIKNEGCDQKTIASYCEIEQATVGSILLRMENAGLIERKQKPGNRRSLFVYLTEKGKEKAQEMSQVFSDTDRAAAKALTPDEEEILKELLCKVCTSLEEVDE